MNLYRINPLALLSPGVEAMSPQADSVSDWNDCLSVCLSAACKPASPQCVNSPVKRLADIQDRQSDLIRMNAIDNVNDTVKCISHLPLKEKCGKLVKELSKKTETLYLYVHKSEETCRE